MNQYVCLASAPWQAVPTRTQQLMTRLKGAQVLYFEPPGRRWRKPGRKLRPGLTVYTLPPVPAVEERYQLLFRGVWRRQARFIQQQLDRHRFREPVLWCTAPQAVHLLEHLNFRALVYDCDRDWPGLPLRWESDLALAADVIFAASQGLADHLSPCNDNIALLPNGVNHPMFVREGCECPASLRRLEGPVLGYAGTLWHDLDLTPVLHAAELLPRCSFVFLGRGEENPAARALERLPNVRFLSPVPPVEVPDYLSRFDVCLDLPRRGDPENDVVPSRLYEYLSTGKPVVALYRSEQVEPFPDVVYGAHSPEEYARLCRRALAETGDWARLRRREHGTQAAWSRRAEDVQRILATIGLY